MHYSIFAFIGITTRALLFEFLQLFNTRIGFLFDIHIGYQLFWIGWWVLLLVYSFLLVLHFLTHHDSHENCNKKVEGRRRKLRSMHWLICHVLQGNNVFTKNKHVALDKIFWWIQLIQSGIQVIRNSVSFIRHNWSNIFRDNKIELIVINATLVVSIICGLNWIH